jgi:DNA-binding beta-propeller fold protein YncE
MRLFFINVREPRAVFLQVGAALAVATILAGCGDNYRPVVTPVASSGPPAQPSSSVAVVSTTGATTPGVVTFIDYSGDSIMDEVPIGPGPRVFTIDEVGATGYTVNSDGTLSNFALVNTLQEKQVSESTLPSTAQPVNLMAPSSGLWATDLNDIVGPDQDQVDLFSGSPEAYKLSIPVVTTTSQGTTQGTMPVLVTGSPTLTGEREYVISQNVADTPIDTEGVVCNNPMNFASEPTGVATPIEISSNTADPAIPVGKCPVYALESSDQRRFFVLNRGDDTITVINAQNNTLDQCPVPLAPVPPSTVPTCPPPYNTNQNGQPITYHPVIPLSTASLTPVDAPPNCNMATNPTCGMGAVAGPVYAEYNAATQQLVTANYDGGSISVIDVSLDEYGNDSSTFGTTYTIPVGITATPNPASVTVLYDGSKAYTANQNDDITGNGTGNGTVTVVNLSTHTVEKTLTVVGHPRTVASTQNSEYSKIYTAAPDSPEVTIIESTPTVVDLIDTTVQVEGSVVDLRVTTQNAVSGNANFWSRVPGYGQPCNLPGAAQYASLTQCQATPTP